MAKNRKTEEKKTENARTPDERVSGEAQGDAPLTGFRRAVPIVNTALAIYLFFSLVSGGLGVLGSFLSSLTLGLFSYGAYAIPPLLLIHAVFYRSDVARRRVISRIIFSAVTLLAISVTVYTAQNWQTEGEFLGGEYYSLGKECIGGGLFGSSVAFALIKLLDYVGVIIVAGALIAIYVTYFFSSGGSTLKDLGYKILKGTVIVLATVERWIKSLFSPKKKDKTSKKRGKATRKTLANREKLYEDDFFDVDNGIEALEISELGIREQRSRRSIEAHLTLQEKVHRRSDVLRDDLAEEVDRKRADPKDTYYVSEDFGEPERSERGGIRDFDIDGDGTDTKRETPRSADTNTPPATDNADDVFTSGFDPFAFSGGARASESSSVSSLTEVATYRETIREITEEDVERARRNAQFEARKAMLKKQEAERQAEAQRQAEAKRQAEIARQAEEARQAEVARQAEIARQAEEARQAEIARQAETPASNIPTPITEESATVKTVEYRTHENPDPYIREEDSTSLTFEKSGQVRYREVRYSESEAGTVHERRFETEPRPVAVDPRPVAVDPTPIAGDEVATIPVTDEPVSYFSTERDIPSTGDGLVFEFSEESADIDNVLSSGDLGVTLEIERTRLGEAVERDEDEDDIDTSTSPEEDVSDTEDEIPPEEQNPAVHGYRDMFSMFRNDEKKEESLPEQDEPVSPIKEEPDAPIAADPPYETLEEDEEEPEELDLPFESPSVTPARAATPPKEEKAPRKTDYSRFQPPPIDLLLPGEEPDDEEINVEINQNTATLIETLASFNVTASIKGVDRGPRITRYEVVPARGVKVQAITGLFDDIALNLAAEGIRMEAPIPGKSAIGFEIPNKHSTNVTLRELLECEEFVNAKSKTFVCIGKDVAGNPVFGDIAKFPHALVAGATGMGKSVCINSIMISMLYKARPDEVKFIMIDPKKVEFRMYSGIPHLLIPVITEAKQAAGALMWAVEEMERRYSIIEQLNIRNIETYNEKCATDKSLGDPLPKIVIVIDELNDLMMQVRDPVEDLIMRIAQKARAAGIHLIIGTQRPDVKVVTGTIKANINTRISCKVTSVQDSRTILEMAGAEKLLNKGDMLFKPVDKPKPIRVQGCFVSDPEVEAIMAFLKEGSEGASYDDEVLAEINRAAQKCGNKKSQGGLDDGDADGDGEVGYYSDQQFLDAVDLAIRSGKVSTSLLQRKLSIGYGKAAKYIDAMEDIGVVSEANGMKPRSILLTMDEWHDKLSRVSFED